MNFKAKEMIKFSIVIPTYNRAELLKRCLQSVISQTYSNWEAIVVDNFSEDNTEEVVVAFNDNRIKFFKNHNYGIISVSRNFALDRVKGDWICYLDSDDYWYKDKLEQLLPYLGDFDLIYHGYETNIKRTRLFQRTKIMPYKIKEAKVSYLLQRGDPIMPSCAVVSRDFAGSIRFAEDKSLFAIEDYDYFLQIIEKKPRIKRLSKYLTFYDVETGVSHNSEAHRKRSRLIYSKWREKLSEKEFRNVLKLYMNFYAGDFYTINPPRARHYFWIAASSSVWEVKKNAIYGVLKTYLLQIINFLNR